MLPNNYLYQKLYPASRPVQSIQDIITRLHRFWQEIYIYCFRISGLNLVISARRQIVSWHYIDVIMITMTSLTVAYPTVYSDADQRKHQSSASLAFVWGIHRDRWIPRTKGQLRGKCFHLMTSSRGNEGWPVSHNLFTNHWHQFSEIDLSLVSHHNYHLL